MKAFADLGRAATAGATGLDAKTKELLALAIAVASRCDGCIGFHVKNLVHLGMTQLQLHDALAVAIYMGGGPAAMYAANAISAFDEFTPADQG
jgi:AhpD family alkylhydroperoxidase